eukprot:4581132-Amphidinium_carterae.1
MQSSAHMLQFVTKSDSLVGCARAGVSIARPDVDVLQSYAWFMWQPCGVHARNELVTGFDVDEILDECAATFDASAITISLVRSEQVFRCRKQVMSRAHVGCAPSLANRSVASCGCMFWLMLMSVRQVAGRAAEAASSS